jgi:DNA polymerase III gamma/tau subunit
MKTIILNILNQEQINYDHNLIEEIIQNIYSYSNGDLRKAITLLQRVVYVSRLNNIILNNQLIDDIIGIIPNDLVDQLYSILNENDNSYQKMTSMIKTILNKGYSSTDIINKLSTKILNDCNIIDNKKSSIFLKMSDISNLLSCESGDYIQLLALCSYINNILYLG